MKWHSNKCSIYWTGISAMNAKSKMLKRAGGIEQAGGSRGPFACAVLPGLRASSSQRWPKNNFVNWKLALIYNMEKMHICH